MQLMVWKIAARAESRMLLWFPGTCVSMAPGMVTVGPAIPDVPDQPRFSSLLNLWCRAPSKILWANTIYTGCAAPELSEPENMLRTASLITLCLILIACAQQPARDDAGRAYQGVMPVDLSGSWERDYSRGDDVNKALSRLFRQLNRSAQGQQSPNYGRFGNGGPIALYGDVSSILALARLAELVTRPTVLTISQSENEIRVEREGDFAMVCDFYDNVSHGAVTEHGTEVCGWTGEQFVSRLLLPDGVVVSHRFTMAPDLENMHVATTVSSSSTRIPFTLHRFYTRFEPLASEYNCIETLSKKRVCSTSGGKP